MKAVAYFAAGGIDRADALIDIYLPTPVPGPADLLVRIGAISVNPADYKIRAGVNPPEGQPRILGWDAAGTVEAVGEEVIGFAVGDRVYYAGDLNRPGVYAEYNLVDYRIAAIAPATLSDAEAAALPLTAITAWEMLFDRLDVTRPVAGGAPAVLLVGAAGGVGSVAIQLLRARTNLTIVATASRPETQEWCRSLGAHYVIDHSRPLADQVVQVGIGEPSFVFSMAESAAYRDEIIRLIAPQGRFGLIDDPGAFDITPFKWKSLSVHWESIFTRPVMRTADMARQGEILAEVAALVEAGKLRSTATKTLGRISSETLIEAHRLLETGKARGKLVLEGIQP